MLNNWAPSDKYLCSLGTCFFCSMPLPSNKQHLSYDVCLELRWLCCVVFDFVHSDMGTNASNCYMFMCVRFRFYLLYICNLFRFNILCVFLSLLEVFLVIMALDFIVFSFQQQTKRLAG